MVKMKLKEIRVEAVKIKSREEKIKFLINRFKYILSGKILDVGCGEAYLKKFLKDIEYIGIDKGNFADIQIDLERIDKLPFDDCSFDCVLCLDVLEHLDNLHIVFDELIRVSKKHIIISLPNNWVNARVPIQRGRGKIGHYGLPAHPPNDRHKWFFNTEEAFNFVIEKQNILKNFFIKECFATEKKKNLLVRWIRRLLYFDKVRYLNRYANTLWFHLVKS